MDASAAELELYIDKNIWVDQFGRDDGMLVSGLFDVMFDIYLNLKLISLYREGACPGFSPTEPDVISVGDIYDTLFLASISLGLLVGAGPDLLVSLKLDEDPRFKRNAIALDSPDTMDGAFALSTSTIATIEHVLVEENFYSTDLFDAVISLAEISGSFCLECHNAIRSSHSKQEVVRALILSYVAKAKTCANRNYSELFVF